MYIGINRGSDTRCSKAPSPVKKPTTSSKSSISETMSPRLKAVAPMQSSDASRSFSASRARSSAASPMQVSNFFGFFSVKISGLHCGSSALNTPTRLFSRTTLAQYLRPSSLALQPWFMSLAPGATRARFRLPPATARLLRLRRPPSGGEKAC